ncbi:MazG-like family protein [Kitasatospora cineracea]|uniref:MazG-like family protein n=1 Tax=Kitasatospora cineracea TaxID=88074 RepID=UPI0033EC6693
MDIFDTINSLAQSLNSLSTAPPEQAVTLQALKVSEEAGELAEAVIGALAANPRKGASHSWEDVYGEACDVAVTALILLARRGEDPRQRMKAHLQHLVQRSLTPAPTA